MTDKNCKTPCKPELCDCGYYDGLLQSVYENKLITPELIENPSTALAFAEDTEEQLLTWFRDNDWLRAIHSENILRNQRHIACLFIHPSGIYAHGSGDSELAALRAANRIATKRLHKLKELTGSQEPKL